jgi:ABC-type uncharacterized transport system substrate-binding protein
MRADSTRFCTPVAIRIFANRARSVFHRTRPVEEGFVASSACPGGTVTGITPAQSDHVSKHLPLLRDVVPTLADVGAPWSPANLGSNFTFRDLERAAAPLQMKIQSAWVRTPEEFEDRDDQPVGSYNGIRPG